MITTVNNTLNNISSTDNSTINNNNSNSIKKSTKSSKIFLKSSLIKMINPNAAGIDIHS